MASELASYLANKGAETVLIDRQYRASNIDIILGLKKYQKHDASNLEYQLHDMDENSANDYLIKVNNNLKVLALEGNQSIEKLVLYTNNIADLLIRHANFIVDDYSSSIDYEFQLDAIADKNDILVLVIEPTISSVRTAQTYLQQVSALGDCRVLLFLNIHRPAGAFSLTQPEIETYLENAIDVVLPYNKTLATQLLEGKRIYQQEDPTTGAICQLALKIKGKNHHLAVSPFHKFKAMFKR
ncbi:hypothetical protein [Photobacterium leiognathi]|uniref:hypothetical protein n=1 Tax=Photobacterium leiognathi TaxID=553611 RepID=UPI003AF409AF